MSAAAAERTCEVVREARAVDEARRFAELAVAHCDDECREATEMAVTELAENLVKYCGTSAGAVAGTISIRNEQGMIRIRAINRAASDADARVVKESIDGFSRAPDVNDLYRARLALLFTTPNLARGRLGLLRMVCEGGFRLSCDHRAPVLVIEAERPCISA